MKIIGWIRLGDKAACGGTVIEGETRSTYNGKGLQMKTLPALLLFVAATERAAEPSREAVSSCLLGRAASPAISVKVFATNEVFSQDNYQPGYSAPYYFRANGVDIGYAQKGKQAALIYGARLYTLARARPISHTVRTPAAFEPDLADWSQVRDNSSDYLCVSFNFEGLGRSGSFQNVPGAYLLSLTSRPAQRQLFFVVANTKTPVR